jgi:hypothetical protein
VIVRDDAPAGVQAAMIVHAAGHSAQLPGASPAAPPAVAVALLAPVGELIALSRALADHDLPHVLVREPDEPWCNAPMAIGVVPTQRARVRRLLAHLPLVRTKDSP